MNTEIHKLDSYLLDNIERHFGKIVIIENNLKALSNNVFYLNTKNGNIIVLKVFKKGFKKYFNRKQEIKIYNENLNFIPKLLHYNYKKFFVFEYIEGLSIKNLDLENEQISCLVSNLVQLHNLSLNINKRNFFKSSNKYLKDSVILDKILYNNITLIGDKISSNISKFDTNIGLSHNDLNQNNIILNKKTNNLYLIDFEYSSYNDIYIDLASVGSFLKEEKYEEFLSLYEEQSGIALNKNKLKYYFLLVDYASLIWYHRYGYLDFAEKLYNKLKVSL